MSVIAWDGKTLAADRMAVSADMQKTSIKIRDVGEAVLAWSGTISAGQAMALWWANGKQPDKFPAIQRTNDWSYLIVAYKNGGIWCIEQEPIETEIHESFMAWGAGRDFAMGAMAMGADAKQAVEIASRFSVCCGNGVDVYHLSTL